MSVGWVNMRFTDVEHPSFEDLELLVKVSELLTDTNLDNVLQQVIELAKDAVGAVRASFFLHEGQNVDWDHIFTMRNLAPDQSVKVITQVLDHGFAGWVYRHKRGDIIDDTLEDDRWVVFSDDDTVTRSVLCVPFIDDDEVMAVLTLVHPDTNHFQAYHLRLMTIIANQATIAVRNAQLFSQKTAQQRFLEAVIQGMTDALITIDTQGNIMTLNDAALEMMDETDVSSVMGRALDVYSGREPIFDHILQALNSAQNFPILFDERSLRERDYLIKISILHGGRDELRGYIIVMHDVTMLQDLSRFKDEMLKIVTHDLRGPLSLITGYNDIISQDIQDDVLRGYTDVIRRAASKMKQIVGILLRVEQIKASELEFREEVDFTNLVEKLIEETSFTANAKGLTILTDIELDHLPHISLDEVMIMQAMTNLVNNAIKYTPENGTIRVRCNYDDQRVYFVVSDTGIGISNDHLPHVFKSFYRVDQSASFSESSGLGLNLVQSVIQRHGGDVWVTSELFRGSEFGFYLPLKANE
ncbi:hypothetical protein MASR2M15_05550 [Anaerolineales bacterium]